MQIPFKPADILLPNCDLYRWSVIACDQYTSNPEYWRKVEEIVGDAPSSLNLIFPEIYLGKGNDEERISKINRTMHRYVDEGLFDTYEDSIFYIERTQSNGSVRRGIIGAVDLEAYDYGHQAKSAIRATEGTVVSRIPPRLKIRENALLELPHIMLLMDDAENSVIEPLTDETSGMEPLYDFNLMAGAGSIRGWRLTEDLKKKTLERMEQFAKDRDLVFAVGDGNHSLATAKASYEKLKTKIGEKEAMASKARYALVEIENIYDNSLQFEPIHRVVFDTEPAVILQTLKTELGARIDEGEIPEGSQIIHFVTREEKGTIIIPKPKQQLEVGTLQTFLDKYLEHRAGTLDYIHDRDEAVRLASENDTIAFLLPAMKKERLFPAVERDGALPRKTFSMGDADDKRFYLEARVIG